MSEPYPDTQLFIDGRWREGSGGGAPVIDPATEEAIGRVRHASREDVEAAVTAAQRGFESWRATAVHERARVLRQAAALLRERSDTIARWMSLEQGKPTAQAKGEALFGADLIEWLAEGARLLAGGARQGRRGYFFPPTVLAEVPTAAEAMNVEPFGPVALLNRFNELSEAIAEASRLPYGLAAYAYTNSRDTARRICQEVEAGMVSINHFGLGLPELPFGGVKDSGYGSEGGPEAIDAYLTTKVITDLSG